MTARRTGLDPRRAAADVGRTVTSATKSVRRRTTRRGNYSSGTRTALIDSARILFTETGYAGTSLDEIVARARVTKGALYHHFGSKLALFEAVFEQVQLDGNKRIEKAMNKATSPTDRAAAAISTFLQMCQEPTYRRIVLLEAPVALGHESYQDVERRTAFEFMEGIVADLVPGLGGDEELTEAFTHVFFGAVRSAGAWVADSVDPERTAALARSVFTSVVLGLNALEEMGGDEDGDADED